MEDDRRRSVAPPEVDWEHLDKKKFLMLGAAVFSVRETWKILVRRESSELMFR